MEISSFWVYAFFINWILNILAVEFLALRKIKKIIKVDEERDKQYPAFRRPDVKHFNRPWLFLSCHLSLFKVVFAISFLVLCGFSNVLILLGHKRGEKVRGLRYYLLRISHYITSCVVLFCASGCIWIRIRRPKVCYKKYLGEDWKPDYDYRRAGSVICNHSSFLDAPLHAMA